MINDASLTRRAADITDAVDGVIRLVNHFRNGADSGTVASRDAQGPIALLDEVGGQTRGVLLEAMEERGYRQAQIRDGQAELDGVMVKAGGAANFTSNDADAQARADSTARALIRKAQQLRADLAMWKTALAEAERQEVQLRNLEQVLADNRAEVYRKVEAIEARVAAGRRTAAAGQLLHRAGEIGDAVDAAADVVRREQAQADAGFAAALNSERGQLMQGAAFGADTAVEDELRRLREGH